MSKRKRRNGETGPVAPKRQQLTAEQRMAVASGEVERLCLASVRERRAARMVERQAVELGRGEAGLSWDQLGRWLDMPGETLRRRYGGA